MNVIIFPLNNKLSVIIPADNTSLSIGEIAIKDVPSGVPYKIIDSSLIPTDRTFRDAWEADFTDPDGYGIGQEQWFQNKLELYNEY
jgi:hypothetical protein